MSTLTAPRPQIPTPQDPYISQDDKIHVRDHSGMAWTTRLTGNRITICDAAGHEAMLEFTLSPATITQYTPLAPAMRGLSVGIAHIFCVYPEIDSLRIAKDIAGTIAARDIAGFTYDAHGWTVWRDGFYQAAPLWITHKPASHIRAQFTKGPEGRDHPVRPPAPSGEMYRRYDREYGVDVTLRALDIGRDIDRFHRWMNDGRVAYFWELAEPRNRLVEYLEGRQADPHTDPVIVSFDGEAAGYFETYWVREDRLGPYYASGPWDRGWHALIGEKAHLGRKKTAAWIRALTHYLFLDCPLTENIMGEPRADNVKLLRYADAMSYEKLKEFDFPHKRSALMRCQRARFFREQKL